MVVFQDLMQWRTIGLAKRDKGLYMLKVDDILVQPPPGSNRTCSLSSTANPETWHNHLGHLFDPRLKILHTLDSLIPQSYRNTCETCHLA